MSGKLGYSKTDCEKILRERIEEVQSLFNTVERPNSNFLDEYAKFTVEIAGWREINFDILKKMFPEPSIAKRYDRVSSGRFHLVSHNEYDSYQGYKQEIAKEVGFLETCIKKLQFFEEPETVNHVFGANQQFSAFLVLNDILKNAKSSIFLVDGYVDEKTLGLLTTKQFNVTVCIFTKSKSITQIFRTGAQSFQKQHGSLEVRCTEDYHDRFIIIDGKEVFQSGGSVKDLGGKAATLLQLTTPQIVGPLISQINNDWQKANQVI